MSRRFLVITAVMGAAVVGTAFAQAPMQLYPRTAPATASPGADTAPPLPPADPQPDPLPNPRPSTGASPGSAAPSMGDPASPPTAPHGITVETLPPPPAGPAPTTTATPTAVPSAPAPRAAPQPASPALIPSPAPSAFQQAAPPASPRDEVLTTVEGFYAALSRGDGQQANAFLVPEKRNQGAFDIAAMTRFYSAMNEPLRVIGVGRLDPDVMRVHYVYAHQSGRRCDGVADVTVHRVNGQVLIERIRALSGC